MISLKDLSLEITFSSSTSFTPLVPTALYPMYKQCKQAEKDDFWQFWVSADLCEYVREEK